MVSNKLFGFSIIAMAGIVTGMYFLKFLSLGMLKGFLWSGVGLALIPVLMKLILEGKKFWKKMRE